MATNLRDQMANVVNQIVPSQPAPEAAPEARPLLRSFPNPSAYGSSQTPVLRTKSISTGARLKDHLMAEVDTRWAELILIVCFFISGTIDAGAYSAYECFCSMQTGNTVFAALGVSDLPVSSPRLAWTKSVVSVFAFLLGSVATASFHRRFGERKRWVLAASFALQAIFIIIAGVLVYRGNSSGSPGSELTPSRTTTLSADPGFPWTDLIPISLLAFQAAGKIIASRVLGLGGLPSIVLTALFADLVSDPSFFSAGLLGNAQRNRRLGGATFYFVGAVVGGVAAKYSEKVGFSGGLFIAAGFQMATVAAWLMWRREKREHGEGD